MAPTASSPPHQKSPPDIANGIFQNGAWYCKCGLIARKRTVKTNTKNYGKAFYVCHIKRDEGNWCDFFLLAEDAEKRERAWFLSNGRSEKRQATLHESITPRKGKQKGKQKAVKAPRPADQPAAVASASGSNTAAASRSYLAAESSTLKESAEGSSSRLVENNHVTTSDEDEEVDELSSPTRSHGARHAHLQPSAMAKTPTGSKRKRPLQEEDLLDELSSGGEEELVAMSEMSTKHYDALITPNAPRTADIKDGMPTPSLTHGQGRSTKKVLFKGVENGEGGSPTVKRQRLEGQGTTTPSSSATALWGTSAVIDAAAPSSSPAPTPQTPTMPDLSPDNLAKEVMELLKDVNITKAARAGLRKTLERYAAQAKGYERGRDAARKVAKEAEERCSRLQAKVDALENSRQELRTQLMDMWSKL